MRDILNLLEQLNEATNLAPSELTDPKRFEKFLWKIANNDPFLNKEREQVFLDPAEATRLAQLAKANQFKGSIKAKTVDGDEIALSQLLKTNDLGGQQGDPHNPGKADASGVSAGKESLLVKPKLIQITDFDIPASGLHKVIASNQILNSTEYGKVVIQLANNIVSGNEVALPEEYTNKSMEKIRKAIVDYAGEYLGVLALISGRTKFDNQNEFLEWLGGSLGDLTINFPGKSNTNIADSYATIKNKNTAHSINISSKGTGGGAAPAISGLKISDRIRKNGKLKNAVKFIDLCQAKSTNGPSTITQAFEAMNFINQIAPESISKKFRKFLPWDQTIVDIVTSRLKVGDTLPAKYRPAFQDINTTSGKATEAGALIYAVKKDVAEAINDRDAIPEFKKTILEVLEMNFIQQYTDYSNGQLNFETQWPAKLNGDISVVNKSSASEPTSGGFSFKLGRPTIDDEGPSGDTRDNQTAKSSKPIAGLDKPVDTHQVKNLRARREEPVEKKPARARR